MTTRTTTRDRMWTLDEEGAVLVSWRHARLFAPGRVVPEDAAAMALLASNVAQAAVVAAGAPRWVVEVEPVVSPHEGIRFVPPVAPAGSGRESRTSVGPWTWGSAALSLPDGERLREELARERWIATRFRRMARRDGDGDLDPGALASATIWATGEIGLDYPDESRPQLLGRLRAHVLAHAA